MTRMGQEWNLGEQWGEATAKRSIPVGEDSGSDREGYGQIPDPFGKQPMGCADIFGAWVGSRGMERERSQIVASTRGGPET